MEIQKIVIKAYQKKYLSKEQFLELNTLAQTSSTEQFQEYLIQQKILTPQQLKELQSLLALTAPTPHHLEKSASPEDALTPQQIQQELKKLSSALQEPEEWLGKTFAQRYNLHTLLGKGGMGVVYLAHDSKLHREVALKLIRFEPEEKEYQNRFLQEATSLAKLNHPNIVRIYEVGEEPQCYFTMEYVSGETLAQILKKQGPLRSTEAAEYIQKIADALVEVHEQQLTHLDIKPSNILVSEKNETKLMDFGLARKLENRKSKLSKIAGTFEYMAPEQINGTVQEINATTDVYLLGGTLYELLTGKAPFEGETKEHKIYQALYLDPILPHKLNPSVHNDLEAICLKALEKEQNRRYESAKAFAHDLNNFLEHEPVEAKRPTKWTHVRKWIRRKPGVSALLLLLVLGMTGSWGYFWWKEHLRRVEEESKKNAHFKKLYEDTGETLEKVERLKGKDQKEELSEKAQLLLKGLNLINEALSLYPQEQEAEKRKLRTGKELLRICYESKDYELALYVAENLNSLAVLKEEEKADLVKEVQRKRDQLLKEHLESLEGWIAKADFSHPKYEGLEEGEIEDFIFEVSQMGEPEIYERLMEECRKGIRFFLETKPDFRGVKQEEYYGYIVKILGRLGNQKAIPELYDALEKMNQKLQQEPPLKKNLNILHYLSELANALGNLKALHYAEKLDKIRHKIGQNGLFWSKTEITSKKLAPGRIHFYDNFLLKNPQSAKVYTHRGNAKSDLKNYEGAIQDHTEAIRLNPQLAVAFSNRGLAKLALKDYEGAVQDHTEAIRLNPQLVEAFINRGLAKKGLKDYTGAVQDYTEALRLNPQFAEAYTNRGVIKYDLKDYSGAIQDYTEALRLNPQDTLPYANRGVIKFELKDYTGAIQDYIEALRLNPQYVEAYLNRGTAKFALKDYTGAVQDYTEAIRLNPQDAGAYTNRGNAKRQLKDYGGAIQDHTEALRLNPNYAKAYLNRGNTKNDLTDYKGAIQDYTEAIRLNPQYVGAYFNRGLSQFSNGNLEEGFQDFSEANQLSQGIHRANFIQNYSHFEEEYSKKDIDKSLRLFQERKKYEPTARFSSELADALFARIIQSYQKKDFKSAKADLEWLEQCADPTHPKYSKIPQMKAEIEKYQ